MREELAVVYGGPDVGDVIAIVGFVVSAVRLRGRSRRR